MRRPFEFIAYLACVDGVAQIMTGPICNKSDQLVPRFAPQERPRGFVQEVADHAGHVDIGQGIVSTNIVTLADAAVFQDG